jgi:lipid II:glycine glycyltransferase (peptidoglycan interpeptide bridge formation enzyme)
VIQKIEDIDLLTQFNKHNNITTFLQSLEYFQYLKENNIQVELIGELRNGALISACIYSIVNAKRGKALQVMHGPLVMDHNIMTIRQYLDFLKNIAKQNKCDFIRINPMSPKIDNVDLTFKTNGYIPTPFENMFSITNRVDISSKNKNNLLTSFSLILQEKIKDLLQKESKKKLKIVFDTVLGEDCRFLTEQQDNEQQTYDQIKEINNFFAKKNKSLVAKAYYEDQLVAFQTFVINNKFICNHHGAQLKQSVDYNALIHYKTMQKAIEMGLAEYDFWGVSDKEDSTHPWANSSVSKRHFAGEDYAYLSGQDLPLTPKYWLTNLYEKYQKIKRGH